MKSGVANVTKLRTLLKKLGAHESVPAAENPDAGYDDPVAVLIYSFLLWDSTTAQAQDAMQKLVDATVDFNELRVCLPAEIAATIGTRYPRSMERAQRLKSTLHAIYLDQHSVSLEHLAELGKREAKAFIEGLKGIPPYVSARLLQRCYDVHTIPVDDRLVDLFVENGVLTEPVEPDELGGWLSRQVKSKDGESIEAALRVFVDTSPKPQRKKVEKNPVPKKVSVKKTPVKKVVAKPPAKKTVKKKPVPKAAPTRGTAKKRAATKVSAKKKPVRKKPAGAAKKKTARRR